MDQPANKGGMIAIRLCLMMFLQFFVWGGWYVTVGNYMGAHGMGDLIYWAYTVGPIAAILSPFFLGLVADRFFATERVMGLLHLIGGVALMLAPVAAAPFDPETDRVITNPFIGLLMLHMLCYMPTLGLTNTLAFHNLSNREKHFPLVRVFGTIGWIIAGLTIFAFSRLMLGADVDRADDVAVKEAVAKLPFFFYLAGGGGVLLGLYSFTLPHTPAPMRGKKASAGDILGVGSLKLLANPSYSVFIFCSFLICIPLAAYYAYAPVFLGDQGVGYAADKVPLFMSFGQMSEILFMLVMPLCFARLGVKWMLLVGMAAWVARYGLFAGAAGEQIKWMVLTGVLLHGICYDFFFVTGQIYVDQAADRTIRGQAQGFLVLVTQGLGMLIGAQIAGLIFRYFSHVDKQREGLPDWGMIWLIPCVAAAGVMVLFFVLFRNPRPDADAAEPAD